MSTLTSLVKSGKRTIAKTKTALGLPDHGISHDPMRPQAEVLSSGTMTALGRLDRGVSQDPMRPQDDTVIGA